MVFTCCVPNCGRTNYQIKMHMFPRDAHLSTQWCQVIRRVDLLEKHLKNYRVCDIHFADNCKFVEYHNRTNLKHFSIPTLHLPVKQEPYVEDEKPKITPQFGVVAVDIPKTRAALPEPQLTMK